MAMLKHIAVSLDDIFDWCRKNNAVISQACTRFFDNLSNLLKLQIKSNIPILTVYVLSDSPNKSVEDLLSFSDFMADFFDKLLIEPAVSKYKIKISVFGKWYKLPSKMIESIKKAIEETKEYDSFFINFCINYDGQEEILDACKLIAKQVELGKLDSEMITKESIKENIYSSYFLPPDIIIIYGERRLSGLLLWDSVNSGIVFADKPFMEFDEKDFEKVVYNSEISSHFYSIQVIFKIYKGNTPILNFKICELISTLKEVHRL